MLDHSGWMVTTVGTEMRSADFRVDRLENIDAVMAPYSDEERDALV